MVCGGAWGVDGMTRDFINGLAYGFGGGLVLLTLFSCWLWNRVIDRAFLNGREAERRENSQKERAA